MKIRFVLLFLLLLSTNAYALSWSDASANPASGSQYSPGKNYNFQISWNGDGETVTGVLFELTDVSAGTKSNNTVYNVMNLYYVNFTGLEPSDYSFRWFAEDSSSNTNITDAISYSVVKNSSAAITLLLDERQGNKSYAKNDIATFSASLNIPGKTIYLDSDYPGIDVNNTTSIIYAQKNLTYEGTFILNASWPGDDFYESHWKAFYFDNKPPFHGQVNSYPWDYTTYSPNLTINFNTTWSDVNLTEVRFESNHTGKKKNYTTKTEPKVQNMSGVFWVDMENIFPAEFAYRWYAKDDANNWAATEARTYNLFKALALNVNPLSSEVYDGTTSVINCFSITDEIDISDFEFSRNGTKISNSSMMDRIDATKLDIGYYEYICETEGNKNYSNQTIVANLTVLSKYTKPKPEAKKELKISDVSSVYVLSGESTQGTFNLSSTLEDTVTDLSVIVENLDEEWYEIGSLPSAILEGGYTIVEIDFDIPYYVEAQYIGVKIKATGQTDNGSVLATGTMPLSINEEQSAPNQPPEYFDFSTTPAKKGETAMFSFMLDDDSGLSGYIFSTNETGSWVNDSWVFLDGKEGSIDIMKDVASNPGTVVAWKVYANDTNNAWSSSMENFMQIRQEEEFGYIIPLVIVIVAIVVAVVMLFLNKKEAAPSKKVVYVYTKDS
ncbi:MAG: hypothetical protein JW700_00020 [Candidatus Aenigmarchaeota archaeon]|nr:hypothetical protein [Candidatus Aenigmarchaeota archaeon]